MTLKSYLKKSPTKIVRTRTGKIIVPTPAYNDKYSCPLIVNGTVILFGGTTEPKQISVLFPFGWKRANSLNFNFTRGRCHLQNDTIFLCFDDENFGGISGNGKKCRSR